MPYKDITPQAGEKITRGQILNVPDQPVIPFIHGDGTGPDLGRGARRLDEGLRNQTRGVVAGSTPLPATTYYPKVPLRFVRL